MSFAERNVLSAFEFAQKIVQAKDIQELVRMQTEFVQSQIQVLSEQVKDLGETATKAAEIATKTTTKSVKDLGETATKAAVESVKDLGETAAGKREGLGQDRRGGVGFGGLPQEDHGRLRRRPVVVRLAPRPRLVSRGPHRGRRGAEAAHP